MIHAPPERKAAKPSQRAEPVGKWRAGGVETGPADQRPPAHAPATRHGFDIGQLKLVAEPLHGGPGQRRAAAPRAAIAGAASGTTQLKKHKQRIFSNKNKMSLDEFRNPVPWRRWAHAHDDSGVGDEVKHVPQSTHTLPSQLSHVTHYLALPSIRQTGLDPNRVNSGSGLNVRSGTSKYFARDAHLKAVYLGTDKGVGTSMESEEQTKAGGRVELRANLPYGFRYQHVREAPAVIRDQSKPFNERENSNTALSFGRIPPKYLSVVHPQTGRLHPLTKLRGEMGREFDFSQFATKPAKNRPDLKSNQKDMDDKAALARRLAMASWKQPAPTPAPLEAPKKQKEPEKPFEMPSAMAAKIASLQNKAPAKNDASDDEWGE